MRTIKVGWLAVLAAALLLALAACGREAPPRAAGAPTAGRPGPTSAKQPGTGASAATSLPANQTGGDPRALGDPGAPITIIEYSDYQ